MLKVLANIFFVITAHIITNGCSKPSIPSASATSEFNITPSSGELPPSEHSLASSTVVQIGEPSEHQKVDVVMIIDNGQRMNTHHSFPFYAFTYIEKNIDGFIEKVSQFSKLNITLISASDQSSQRCSAVVKQGKNMPKSFYNHQKAFEQFNTHIDCSIDSYSDLKTLTELITTSSLHGIDASDVFRSDAMKVILTVSDNGTPKAYINPFTQTLEQHWNPETIRFYSISAASNKTSRKTVLNGPRKDYFKKLLLESEFAKLQNFFYYDSHCGSTYTDTYQTLSSKYQGKLFKICNKDYNGHFTTIGEDIKTLLKYTYIISQSKDIDDLAIKELKIDGQVIESSKYQLIKTPGVDAVIKILQDITINDDSEIEFQTFSITSP